MIALLLALASASPCDDLTLATGPVSVGLRDGDLGSARHACPRTEVCLSGHALLLDDSGNLNIYGQIQFQGILDGSLALSDKSEVFVRIEAFRHQEAISLVGASYNGLGHTTLGASTLLLDTDSMHVAVLGRLVLPTAIGLYRNQAPVGLEAALSAQYNLSQTFHVHGYLPVLGSMGVGLGPKQVRVGLAPVVGLETRVGKHFGVVVDVASGFLYDHPFEQLSPQLGLRTAIGPVGVELDAMLPLLGPTPRPLASAELRVSARF